MNSYKFFQNREREYFPCHKIENTEDFNCLFCYCPLYALGDKCGGSIHYLPSGVKSCEKCIKPHLKQNYETIIKELEQIVCEQKNPNKG